MMTFFPQATTVDRFTHASLMTGWFEGPLVKGKRETGELADKDGQ